MGPWGVSPTRVRQACSASRWRGVGASRASWTCPCRPGPAVAWDRSQYSESRTRPNCGKRDVSWLCWCGRGSCATILFVGAGLRVARRSTRETSFGSYVRGCPSPTVRPASGKSAHGYILFWCCAEEFNDAVCLCLVCVSFGREWGPASWRVGYGQMRVLCGIGEGLRRGARARRRGLCREALVREGTHVRVFAGLRLTESVTLVTTTVVRDTPLDRHFSAWSRPKPAPDPLPGPSVASGVIPTKGGRNGVFQPPPGRAPEGRWRSSPWKRCNHAAPRSRVREHPAPLGALRRQRATLLPQGGQSGSTPHRYVH